MCLARLFSVLGAVFWMLTCDLPVASRGVQSSLRLQVEKGARRIGKMHGRMHGRCEDEGGKGELHLGWVTLACCSELADVGCVNWYGLEGGRGYGERVRVLRVGMHQGTRMGMGG
ncbi:hypothetical protein B0T16DRAFT_101497 [Cercophora newfieldiana]|uniref:Secreted protein n=1 Tax=Cercophora newfieldiana TaxID=92897 RepID=A0AA39YJ05_9PEZI|nr:hypothetical protein B0T16DRAFT_101497 [Cercophora newfieldiana]